MDLARKILGPRKQVCKLDGRLEKRTIIAFDIARFCKIAQLLLGVFLPSPFLSKNDKYEQCDVSNHSSAKSSSRLFDPRVALWLLRQGEDEYSMEYLVYKYLYHENYKLNEKTDRLLNNLINNLLGKKDNSRKHGWKRKVSSINCRSRALYPQTTTMSSDAVDYAIAEAFLCHTATPRIESDLKLFKLSDIYHQVEMPALSVLVKR